VILPLIQKDSVIDFGGAAGPVGYGAIIVDPLSQTKALYDVVAAVDTIFASHVLEHVGNLRSCLAAMRAQLKPGGHLIVHSPSYRCERWRAGNYEGHRRTFCLREDEIPDDALRIDGALRYRGFEILLADQEPASDYACLLVIGRKS
jgi:hypothetical protein